MKPNPTPLLEDKDNEDLLSIFDLWQTPVKANFASINS